MHYNWSMRAAGVYVLAAAALAFLGCDVQLATKPDQPDSVPPGVLEILDSQCVTDQEIDASAQNDPTGCLWPPLPDPSCAVYAVTFVWGHLPHPRVPPCQILDWSGELRAPGSEVKILRQIDFEVGEDYLLPVVEPSTVAWVSKTAGDFDGLGLLIRVPAAKPAADSADQAPGLSFKTAPFSVTLPFSKLERLIAWYPVSDTDGVALFARRVDRPAWPCGFIKGEWVPEENDGSRGSITGMWYNLFGIPVGTMAGSFSTGSDGARRFDGWLSGVWLTVVLARFEGTWLYDDPKLCAACGQGRGRFEGTYRYLNSRESGTLRGEFGEEAAPPEQKRLPLWGSWRAEPPAITTDPPEAVP